MIVIERFCDSPMGTFGNVLDDGEHIAVSVEQPWNYSLDHPSGIPYHSCIPAGDYRLVQSDGDKYPDTLAFYSQELEVYLSDMGQGRFGCVMHSANRASELQGCMAYGKSLGCINGEWAILSSRDTTHNVIETLRKNQQHEISIKWRIP